MAKARNPYMQHAAKITHIIIMGARFLLSVFQFAATCGMHMKKWITTCHHSCGMQTWIRMWIPGNDVTGLVCFSKFSQQKLITWCHGAQYLQKPRKIDRVVENVDRPLKKYVSPYISTIKFIYIGHKRRLFEFSSDIGWVWFTDIM